MLVLGTHILQLFQENFMSLPWRLIGVEIPCTMWFWKTPTLN